jgi:tRNA pseudouridine38-40 synthase
MATYKLTISYDGTQYSGWQTQSNALSIQHVVSDKLAMLVGDPALNLIGSGRTDAGVHAEAQVAHFKCDKELDLFKFLVSINGVLPKDIRVVHIEQVEDGFHARYGAIGKEYHYYIHLDRIMNPFRRLYSWHFVQKLDLNLLERGCHHFIGIHDFTSFSNEAHKGAVSRNPVRHLKRLDCISVPGGIRLEFEGDGFLYKMVRNIVGTLVKVASGAIPLESIPLIFEAKNRSYAGPSAPSRGLFLVNVKYAE